jgi:hypothetical protein
MYLWDSNILRHFGEGHPTLRLYLEQISWSEIALPSVVTRNQKHFSKLLPKSQMANWIDKKPN